MFIYLHVFCEPAKSYLYDSLYSFNKKLHRLSEKIIDRR